MNKTSNYELTIIVPVYNEQDNMDRLSKTLSQYIKKSSVKCCVLFVDDGSKDNSLSLIKRACNDNNDFFYISLKKNSGLSAAMKAGIDVAQSKYVGYMDADMQTDVEDF